MGGSSESFEETCCRYVPAFRSTTFALLALLAVAGCWRLLTFRVPVREGYDEGIYCFYAQTLGEEGLPGLRVVVDEWPRNEVLNKGPLPFRLFFIAAAAAACALLGGYTVANIAWLSFLFGIGFIVVAFLLARRWFGSVYGFLIGLLMVFSPLGTGLSRRGLQESCFAFLVVTCVLLYDHCWRRRGRVAVWFLGLALLAGFLTKESIAFLYPSFALAAVYYGRRRWRSKLYMAIPFVVAPFAHMAIVSWLSGSVSQAAETYMSCSATQSVNPYTLKYQSGPWFGYLVDMLLLSPVAFLLAVVGAGSRCTEQETATGRHVSLIYVLSGLAVFGVLPLLGMPLLNVRFVLFLEVYILAFAVMGIVSLSQRSHSGPRWQFAIVCILMALVVANQVVQFNTIFNTAETYDPITLKLIIANGFVR